MSGNGQPLSDLVGSPYEEAAHHFRTHRGGAMGGHDSYADLEAAEKAFAGEVRDQGEGLRVAVEHRTKLLERVRSTHYALTQVREGMLAGPGKTVLTELLVGLEYTHRECTGVEI